MRCVFVAVAAVLAKLTVIKRGRDLVGTTWAPPFLTLSFLTGLPNVLSPPQHYLFRYPFSNLFILIINYLKICETEVLLLLTAAANQYCYFFTVIVEDD